MNKIRKTPAELSVLLDCPTVSLKEFVAVDDDNVTNCGKQRHFGVRLKLKNISDAVSDDKLKLIMKITTSYEKQNTMKSMRSYLDAHSNGEMNNKTVNFK
ncbi:hypothetical protein TNCV_3509331 [Trichonephila clavipes]|nr:hypothetical protein TNCV_3509331 [Trichonephila clavipes]